MQTRTGLTLLALTVAASPAAAGPPERLALILDASGSMKAQLGKQSRMAIAHAVLGEVVQGLPAGLETGLWAYGHRRKNDCGDVEALVPFGPLDRDQLVKRVVALAPLGMTPLTRSVQMVADALGAGGPTTILLISDGEETCQADPCALVKSLRQKGVDFTLHVVGFGVGKKESAQLECMAKEGGGRYFAADSPKALADALGAVVAKPELQGGTLEIRAVRGGKPVRAQYRVEGGSSSVAGWTGEDKPAVVRVVPGTYAVRVEDSNVQPAERAERAGLEVKAEQATSVELALGGTGTIELKATRAGQPVKAQFALATAAGVSGSRGWTRVEGPVSVKVQPGDWNIVVTDANVQPTDTKRHALAVAAGATVALEMALTPTGELEILATRGGAKVKAEYDLSAAGSGDGARGWTRESGPLVLPVLEGRYAVRVRFRSGTRTVDKKLDGVEVRAGQRATAHLSAD